MTTKGTYEKYADLAWAENQWDEFLNSIKGIASSTPASIDGCVFPGPSASMNELDEYINCLTNEINSMNY
jgi:2-methylaconitate cis-trans-isomerase PrpF